MELIFFWVEDEINIKEQGFNFSNHFQCTFKKTSSQSGIVELKENLSYIENFFDEDINLLQESLTKKTGTRKKSFYPKIVNVTSIIGENGVGKTNFLNLINRLLIGRMYRGEEYIVFLKDSKNKKIYGHHTFSNWDIKVSGEITNYKIELKEIKYRRTVDEFFDVSHPETVFTNHEVIFYSPIFDLRDYPFDYTNPNYVDISTNFLIYKDSSDYSGEAFDQIELHRYVNVERQFELSLSSLADIDELNIPNTLNIRFNKSERIEESDLPYEGKAIHKKLREQYSKYFQTWNKEINDARHSKDQIKIKVALMGKVKAWFLANLLDNYFQNLAELKDLDGEVFGLKQDDIKSEDLIQATRELFSKQKYVNGNIINSFIDAVLKVVDSSESEPDKNTDNDSFFYTNTENALTIWSWYRKYLENYGSGKQWVNGFLNLNWRNMSSGEKALLDLYARFYYAYTNFIKDNSKVKFIYILIDEGEIGFHPQWQKQYLSKILAFFKYCFHKYDIQIILTSHSPFLVSDLPKGNIIFLKKENGQCIISSIDRKETFGANIHTLYSDSFFINNGLIGEFSKNKIQAVLDFINIKSNEINIEESKINEYRIIIEMIAEPVLKQKLIELWVEKMGKNEEIYFLRKRLKELEE